MWLQAERRSDGRVFTRSEINRKYHPRLSRWIARELYALHEFRYPLPDHERCLIRISSHTVGHDRCIGNT
jgi:hypothetical protein